MKFREKTTAILLIALFMISTLAVVVPVSADTHTVTSSDLIQNAIDAADLGDTVLVEAGTYTENLVVNEDITLMTTEGATIQPGAGVGIELQSGASGFTLSGFDILSGTLTTRLIELVNSPNNVVISDNVIDTTGFATMGISVGAAGATGLTISENEFIADTGDGSIWGPDVADVSVSDNTFTGPGKLSGYAVEFFGITGISTITGNSISDYGTGVWINAGYPGSGTTVASGVTISENVISGCIKGIRLGYSSGLLGDITDITVKLNILSLNDVGLYVDSDTHVKASTFTVEDNDFLGNTIFALDNENAETVDATLNWWETTDPAVIAGKVDGSVDYIPCLSQSAVDLTATVSGWILDLQYVGSGTVILNPVMPLLGYDADTVVTLTAVPAANWKFVGWSGALSGAVNPETITMDGDKTVTATFMLPTVSIIVDQPTVVLSGKIGSVNTVTKSVTVSNDGNVFVDVKATLIGPDADFFVKCLTIDGPIAVSWPYIVGTLQLTAPDDSITLTLGLNLSDESVTGTYGATLVFEATPEAPTPP